MTTRLSIRRTLGALGLAIIASLRTASPQEIDARGGSPYAHAPTQVQKPLEGSYCGGTLDIGVMRRVAESIISLSWQVAPTDVLPGHCVKRKLGDGSPAAPENWWWDTEFGVPYKWGGLDDDQAFMSKHNSHISAGLHGSERHDDQTCTTGLDCSGLASLAWGIGSTKHSTRDNDKSSLLAFAKQMDILYRDDEKTLLPDWFAHVAPGDLIVAPSHDPTDGQKARSGHVVVVSDISDAGDVCVYEASGHKKVWEKGTGRQVSLEWTAQPREIDSDYLLSAEPGRHWYVWRWCGGFANLTKGGSSYSCATPLRFPDSHYSTKNPAAGKPRQTARAKIAPKAN